MVDKQVRHDRIRMLSWGLNVDERPVGDPPSIEWNVHREKLDRMGLQLRPKPKPKPELALTNVQTIDSAAS